MASRLAPITIAMGWTLRWVICGLLFVNLYGIALSLWSQLFSPWHEYDLYGVFGFFVGTIECTLAGLWMARREAVGKPPLGLVWNPRAAETIRKFFLRSIQVVVATAAVTCSVMVFMARLDGVANETPTFAPRHGYVLESHGRRTEVSRTRYVVVGTSFFVGWNALAMVPTLVAQAILVMGGNPFVGRHR